MSLFSDQGKAEIKFFICGQLVNMAETLEPLEIFWLFFLHTDDSHKMSRLIFYEK